MAGKNKEQREDQGLRYNRFVRDLSKGLRGTIEIENGSGKITRTIPGFPHIKRVYRLMRGVQRVFGNNSFYAEEKLDGYNTRIFIHQKRLLALSRGGFLCPFTTEWLDIWKEESRLEDFFCEHPRWILCAEICGDNPYNSQGPDLPPGAHLRIFDISRENGTLIPPADRCRWIKQYSLPAVPLLGKHSFPNLDDLIQIIKDLNRGQREGIVMKSPDAREAVKFVTPTTDLEDIRDGLSYEYDLHQRFFRNRLLRTALFIQEFDLDQKEYARKIGNAVLQGYMPLKSFEDSAEHFMIFVQSEDTWKSLLDRMQGPVDIAVESQERTRLKGRNMLKIRFRKVYTESTDRFTSILKGFPHTD